MSAQDERAPRAAARTGAASRLPIDPAPLAVPERLRDAYVRWARFLNDEVTFGLDDDGLHTKRHCARVLLLCLLIAEREGLSADEAETLCACAVFHDSRPQRRRAGRGARRTGGGVLPRPFRRSGLGVSPDELRDYGVPRPRRRLG